MTRVSGAPTQRTQLFRLLSAFLLLIAGGAAVAASGGDGPEISRSSGKRGGIVVLWPRVAGGGEAAQAGLVQTTLAELARAVSPMVDVRPSPERVCPRATGCRAVALGAVLVERESGCAVVATVSRPGQSAAELIPWAGGLTLTQERVAFREPPETQVVVTEFSACASLGGTLDGAAGPITEMLKQALSPT